MGSSSKRKKEKKKDFQKPKLKVGKTKAKASNFTDTSFKAKSVVLNQQSLSTFAPSQSSQFAHHLSLLNHNNPSQKRDSLAHLTSVVSSAIDDDHMPQPVAAIIPRVKHLLCDGSNGVRTQLLKLLAALPPVDVQPHCQEVLLWTHAGMTHMATDIRSTSLDALTWLTSVAGDQTVSCAGGWVKTLNCFSSVLGWNLGDTQESQTKQAGWSTTKLSKHITDTKLLSKTLTTLTSFLRAGLTPPDRVLQQQHLRAEAQRCFPLTHTYLHMIPKQSNPYAYLNLFGATPDEDGTSYEGYEERKEVFVRRFQPAIERGLDWARKEQGEVGRAAKGLERVLKDGLNDHDD